MKNIKALCITCKIIEQFYCGGTWMKQAITIGNVTAACGEKVQGKRLVGEFSTGTEVYLPFIIINGKEDGNTVWVNACVHGNELNGVLAAQKLARELRPEDVKGAVIITPICNPLAFREKKRLSFLEGNASMGENTNMGEVFPGRMDGCMTEKLAYVLFQEIKRLATAVVDFHCWGFGQDSKPYTVIKKYADEQISREIFEIAQAFGSPMICTLDMTKQLDEPSPVDRQMDVLCAREGIPSFMAETGHSEWAEQEYIDFAAQGAVNVMKYYGVLEGEVPDPGEQIVLTSRQVIRCKHDGLAIAQVKPHQFVKKGELLSKIVNVYGDVIEEIRAHCDMYTVSLPYQPNVNGGERVAFVGIIEEQPTDEKRGAQK